jgi:superfamily II DNA or RNA helicase
LIKQISNSGNTLVLVNRIDSGKFLINELPDAVFVSGEVKTKDRKDEYDEIKTSTNKIIVATYGVAAVGINIPRIFNLVLLEPGKSFVRVIQSIGRGIRKAEDKDFVQIWDVTSTCKFAKRHLTARKKFYKEAKYPFTLDKVDWQK